MVESTSHLGEYSGDESNPLTGSAPDFSLVLGGPLFQLFMRTHLSGTHLELLRSRIIVLCSIAWLPLLIFSLINHSALGIPLPFLYDVEVHVRFLLALPILIYAEIEVNRRIRIVIGQFTDRGIIIPEDQKKYEGAIASALKLRNSVLIESVIALFLMVFAVFTWQSRVFLNAENSWYASSNNGVEHLTVAGWWYVFISIPLFQFILLRWYFRLFIWYRLLWQISKLNLHLVPTHPDHAAGIGFLDTSVYAFSPVLFAQGCLLSGLVASRIFFGGQVLTDFKSDIAGLVLFAVLMVLAPLLVFTPQMAGVKREGKRRYGALANRYVSEFEKKWIKGAADPDEQLMGSGDIQSLADLANSYAVINNMRVFPFAISSFMQLIMITIIPVLPLLLTIMPISDIVDWVIKTLL
jgi:hypothetical protein